MIKSIDKHTSFIRNFTDDNDIINIDETKNTITISIDVIERIENSYEAKNATLTNLKREVMELVKTFNKIKELIKDHDEDLKMDLLSLHLDSIEKLLTIEDNNRHLYVNQYRKWEKLDDNTKKFIPTAELLYNLISTEIEKIDHAPIVLEFCKSVENELLCKLFTKYAEDIINRGYKMDANDMSSNLSVLLANALKNAKTNKMKTGKVVMKFEFGRMLKILDFQRQYEILPKSNIFQNFNVFYSTNQGKYSNQKIGTLQKYRDFINYLRLKYGINEEAVKNMAILELNDVLVGSFAQSIIRCIDKDAFNIKSQEALSNMIKYHDSFFSICNNNLLKDFNVFLKKNYDITRLLFSQYIDEASELKDYRNRAAHTEYIEREEASNCKVKTPTNINEFIDTVYNL